MQRFADAVYGACEAAVKAKLCPEQPVPSVSASLSGMESEASTRKNFDGVTLTTGEAAVGRSARGLRARATPPESLGGAYFGKRTVPLSECCT